MAEPLPKALLDAETLFKDRFHDYLLVVTDGDRVYCVNSSKTSAIGLGRYAQLLAENEFVTDAS